MKSDKFSGVRIGWFLLLLTLLLAASCTLPSEKNTCCQECLDAASQDPSGYDISIKECSQYELSERCVTYFEQDGGRVGECREVIK